MIREIEQRSPSPSLLARGTGSDLLPQRLQSPVELCTQDRDRKGAAGLPPEHGTAVQGASGLATNLEEE